MKSRIIILAIIIIVIILIGGYFIHQSSKVQAPTTDQTSGWQVSTNTQYGFGFKYPASFFDPQQQPRLLIGDCNYGVFPSKCPNINNMVAQDMIAGGGDASAIESNLSTTNYWDNPGGDKKTINNITKKYKNSDIK